MSLKAGEYDIDSSNGRLLLRTFRRGVAAKAGHDLLIEASVWHGHVSMPDNTGAEPALAVEVDMRQLEVLEGTGGVKALSDGDRREIKETMRKRLQSDQHPVATFTSTHVQIDGDLAAIDGQLTLGGQTHPLRLDVRQQAEGVVTGTATVVQTTWGIKPYTGFLGALKLRDDVQVEFLVTLP
jgi:polyisoprenoid-binding protein YceI